MEDEDAVVADGAGGAAPLVFGQADKLAVQWLDACAAPGTYYTFRSPAGLHCIQVLMTRRRVITVRCFDEVQAAPGGRWLVRALEIWRGEEIGPADQEIFVYNMENSSWVDLRSIVNDQDVHEQQWTSWKRAVSDLAGTFCLQSPRPMSWAGSLFSKDTPILALEDHLEEQSFLPCADLCRHSPDAALLYDNRNLPRQRAYLQALVARESIFARGCAGFDSAEIQAHYLLLRADPSKVPAEKLSAKEYHKLLKDILPEDEIDHDQALVSAMPAGAVVVAAAERPCLADIEGDDSDEPPAGPLALEVGAASDSGAELPGPATPGGSSSSSTSSARSSSSVAGTPPGGGSPRPLEEDVLDAGQSSDDSESYPDEIEGVVLHKERVGEPGGGLRLLCPHHAECGRIFRSLRKDSEVHGRMAPVFLGRLGSPWDWYESRRALEVSAFSCSS